MVSPVRNAQFFRREETSPAREKKDRYPAMWIRAMDVPGMRNRLAGILFPDAGCRFDLTVRRAFPGSKIGGGVIEYELSWKMSRSGTPERRIVYAQFNRNGKCRFRDPIRVGTSPIGEGEREDFLLGRRAITISDPDMSLSIFPLDHRMLWLRDLLHPGKTAIRLRADLRRLFGKGKLARLEGVEVLGYRFGRRCTLRYRLTLIDTERNRIVGRMPIIGKVYHDERGRGIFMNLEQLWNWSVNMRRTRPPLFPRPIGYLPDLRVGFQEAVAGMSLLRIEDGRTRRQVISRAAERISAFHDSRLIVGGRFLPEDEYALLERWTGYLEILCPEYGPTARDLLDRLREAGDRIDVAGVTPTITHRDFYDKQVVDGPGGLSLIDLDTVTMSDPAIDVGNFLAHLFLRAIQGRRSIPACRQESSLFESTYRDRSPRIDERRISFYRATSLLRLACLYAYRPAWRGVCGPLLSECGRQLVELEGRCVRAGRADP